MSHSRWHRGGRGESAGAKLALPVPEEDILRALAELVPPRSDAEANRLLQSVLESPAGQFLVRVALPCAILHREHPTRLLRRARLGDLDAFETLLRLDKSVVFDRGLARRWHELMQHPKPAVRKRLFSALAGRPRPKMDAKSIRSALAGLLSSFAEHVGSSVTARELRTVFTFFAEDGYLADSEMPAGEALTKAIQRHRPRSRKPASREAPGQ